MAGCPLIFVAWTMRFSDSLVWSYSSGCFERLRGGLETMIEREYEARGDPDPEAKAWAATLSEVERKRNKYQAVFAADAMTLDELGSMLNVLYETRETAWRELAALAS